MSRYNHYNTFTTRGYIYRTLVTIASIVILVSLMPRGNQVKLDIKKGKPWNYGTVIARENFPILKAEEQLKQEHDSLLQMYKPIFEMSSDLTKVQIDAFYKAFDKEMARSVPSYYRNHIADKLQEMYSRGVMPTDDYEKLKKDRIKEIVVSVQNMGATNALREVFTPRTAYEFLIHDEDTAHYQRGILQHCNLSRFVTTNLTYDAERSASQMENIDKQLVRYSGQVLAGQKIIDHGDIVDDKAYNILRSMQEHHNGQKRSAADQRNRRSTDVCSHPRVMSAGVFQPVPQRLSPTSTYSDADSIVDIYIPYCHLHNGAQQLPKCLSHSLLHSADFRSRIP